MSASRKWITVLLEKQNSNEYIEYKTLSLIIDSTGVYLYQVNRTIPFTLMLNASNP